MRRSGFVEKLKWLDAHPKQREEVRQQSTAGAIVTFIAVFFMCLLLISETYDYFTPKRKDSLAVYTNRGEKMKVSFKMTFLELPCEAVNLDVADKIGQESIGVQNQFINKIPWRGRFSDYMQKARGSWSGEIDQERFFRELRNGMMPHVSARGCMSCQQAEDAQHRCCNNCYQLQMAFLDKGVNVEEAQKYEQCKNEEILGHEGCLVHGYTEINRVGGSFHFAVGESHVEDGRHHHHWAQQRRQFGFNASHYIHKLTFGDAFEDMQNPLDGYFHVEEGLGQMQYFLEIVPTVYQRGSKQVHTNQFSATWHYSPVDLNEQHVELPGVFFKFEMSPLFVSIQYTYRSFAHYITRLCAVIGGVWVVLGLAYNTSTALVEKVLRRLNPTATPLS